MNLLRKLAGDDKSTLALEAAALSVRRAGLEHLVQGPVTGAEVRAMVVAGEEIAKERAVILVWTLLFPWRAFYAYDGGAMARSKTKQAALAQEIRHGS